MEILKFEADWCQPCKVLNGLLKDLDYNIKAIDIDDDFEHVNKYKIRNVPTLVIIKNGQEVDRIVGVMPRKELIKRLNKHKQ